MRRFDVLLQALTVVIVATGGYAQPLPARGHVPIPESSVEKPRDVGVRAHTNIELFSPDRAAARLPLAARSGDATPRLMILCCRAKRNEHGKHDPLGRV
jgi:hypothetical protein